MTEEKYTRPSWDEYFLEIMETVARRATCDRGRSGCVIVKDKQILVTGYVGSPKGIAHCDEVGHLIKTVKHDDGTESQHCVRTVHAEQNAICQAAKLGIPLEGATLYCKMTPCRTCAMMIINAGIKKVVAQNKYQRAQDAIDLFKEANIELVHINEEVQKYEKQ
jgi:dCMP deaminase